jgi:Tfp pilus assembly protein PilF
MMLGREEEAAVAIMDAREKCPACGEDEYLLFIWKTMVRYHHGKAAEAMQEGQPKVCILREKVVLILNPSFADAHYNIALALVALGDAKTAEQEYRLALQTYSEKEAELAADAKNNLADLLVREKKSAKEATALVRQAIAVRGERASYLDTLARACDLAGDLGCAKDAFEKLLAKGGDFPPGAAEHARKRLAELSAQRFLSP